MLANNVAVADTGQHEGEIGGIVQSLPETGLLDAATLVPVALGEAVGEIGQAQLVSGGDVGPYVHVGPADGLVEPLSHGDVATSGLQPRQSGAKAGCVAVAPAGPALDLEQLLGPLDEDFVGLQGTGLGERRVGLELRRVGSQEGPPAHCDLVHTKLLLGRRSSKPP